MVIFQYNLYIFVRVEHGCLTNTVYDMDPNNSAIKRLWCTYSWVCFEEIKVILYFYKMSVRFCFLGFLSWFLLRSWWKFWNLDIKFSFCFSTEKDIQIFIQLHIYPTYKHWYPLTLVMVDKLNATSTPNCQLIRLLDPGCWFCLFVLRFYGPVNPVGSCWVRSVYLTTLLLGRLSPLSG